MYIVNVLKASVKNRIIVYTKGDTQHKIKQGDIDKNRDNDRKITSQTALKLNNSVEFLQSL